LSTKTLNYLVDVSPHLLKTGVATMMKKTLFVLLFGLALAGLGACTGGGDGNGTPNGEKGNLRTVSGKLTAADAGTSGPAKAKVMMMVGSNKLAAKLDPTSKKFIFDSLPAGAKTLLVDLGDGPLPVKFAKSKEAADLLASLIPDVALLNSLLGTDHNFDMYIGDLTLSADGTYYTPEFNPLSFFDTDFDGLGDWLDGDIDGDGLDNLGDLNPWGDDYGDWGWDEEVWDGWDGDGDGDADWEDSDFSGDGYWGTDDIPGWDVCAESDAACWATACDPSVDSCMGNDEYCAMFPDDTFFCSGVDCIANPTDPACIGVDCTTDPTNPSCNVCVSDPTDPSCTDVCALDPTDPSCGVDCDLDPTNPACGVDCTLTPNDPSCAVDCELDPTDPSCAVDCTLTPDDPMCSGVTCPDASNPACDLFCVENPAATECLGYCIANPTDPACM